MADTEERTCTVYDRRTRRGARERFMAAVEQGRGSTGHVAERGDGGLFWKFPTENERTC